MEPIIIKGSDELPEIILDKINSKFEFSGRSLPEDATEFYQPVQSWISDYIKNPNPVTILNFHLEYFNSSSARRIVEILMQLEQLLETPNKVTVVWHYEMNDDLMKARGEEIRAVIEIPFEIRGF